MPADEQLSMRNVCRLFKRNHIRYQVTDNRILFSIRNCTRYRGRTFMFVEFEEGRDIIGHQDIGFGHEQESLFDDGQFSYLRRTHCTDMAFFAFHLHDLFREIYPDDEYNNWY